jgi:hypothetical protein
MGANMTGLTSGCLEEGGVGSEGRSGDHSSCRTTQRFPPSAKVE